VPFSYGLQAVRVGYLSLFRRIAAVFIIESQLPELPIDSVENDTSHVVNGDYIYPYHMTDDLVASYRFRIAGAVNIYKQILLQFVYQITIILPFHFLGVKILGFELTSANDTIVQTVVFNMFVFAQIFNSVNPLQLDCILSNWYFMAVTIIGELRLSPCALPS